jgi:hypothetical protein
MKGNPEDLRAAIYNLATRMDNDEVEFLDLLLAVRGTLRVVTGMPHYETQPEMADALAVLAGSAARAFARQERDILTYAMSNIGYGVATGHLGVLFFQRVRKKV